MDSQSLFAVLAIAFLLWLVFSWVRWDSSTRTAHASRQRLKSQVLASTLAGKVKVVDGYPTAFDTHKLSDDEILEQTIQRLREQLEHAEEEARLGQQSDLEFRRLRSELQGVEAERFDAFNRIQALEEKIREQRVALMRAGQAKVLKTDVNELRQDFDDRQEQNADVSKRLSTMIGGVENSSTQSKPEVTRSDNDRSSGTVNQTSHVVDSVRTDASVVKAAHSNKAHSDKTRTNKAISKRKVPLTPLYAAPSYKDDLKLIKGIGPVMERTLNELGVSTFKQLADFQQVDIDKVSKAIGSFPGRIERDDWVGRAKKILQEQDVV